MRTPHRVAMLLLSIAGASLFCADLHAQNLTAGSSAISAAPSNDSPVPRVPAGSVARKDSPEPLPALREILDRNEEVMGGRAAWSRLVSQRMTGVYQTEDGSRYFAVEILAKSPNKSLYKLTSSNDVVIRDVCDGQTAWVEDPATGYHEFTGPALASRLHRSNLLDRANILSLAASTGKVTGSAKVGPYVTYVVEFESGKDVTSRIYFDSDSGYIVRAEDDYKTADGPYTVRMDFADYRAIEGMKFPFRMRRTERGSVFYIRLTQLKNNVYIDDAEFSRPGTAGSGQPRP